MRIDKLRAATRQLRAAIRLWFLDDDPIATHTLACAAHEIITALLKFRGHDGLLFGSALIRPGRERDIRSALRKTANFLKHADRDPEVTIDFNPSVNEGLIMFCVIGLKTLGEPLSVEETGFCKWMVTQHPDWFSTSATTSEHYEGSPYPLLVSKTEFWIGFMELWGQGLVTDIENILAPAIER